MDGMYKNFIKILKENDLYNIQTFIGFTDFEEIPIINRYSQMESLKEVILQDDYSFYLFNTSLFVLNNLKMQLKKILGKKYDDFFICITLVNPEEEKEDAGFVIPNIFVSKKSIIGNYLSTELLFNLADDNFLNKEYKNIINSNMFSIYRVKESDHFDRIYILPKWGNVSDVLLNL